jgi:hypothetical protein
MDYTIAFLLTASWVIYNINHYRYATGLLNVQQDMLCDTDAPQGPGILPNRHSKTRPRGDPNHEDGPSQRGPFGPSQRGPLPARKNDGKKGLATRSRRVLGSLLSPLAALLTRLWKKPDPAKMRRMRQLQDLLVERTHTGLQEDMWAQRYYLPCKEMLLNEFVADELNARVLRQMRIMCLNHMHDARNIWNIIHRRNNAIEVAFLEHVFREHNHMMDGGGKDLLAVEDAGEATNGPESRK